MMMDHEKLDIAVARYEKAEADNKRLATIASRTIEAESAAHGAESRAERAEAERDAALNASVGLREAAQAYFANISTRRQGSREYWALSDLAFSDTPNPPRGKLE